MAGNEQSWYVVTVYMNSNAMSSQPVPAPPLVAPSTLPMNADSPAYPKVPLHAELYLLAHDDDTGERHISEHVLAMGLAGALLVELVCAERVVVGWVYDDFRRQWQPRSGGMYVARHGDAGNPLLDAALTVINRITHEKPRGDHLRMWLHAFAGTDLYERTRAAMVTAGLIRRTQRRRYAGLAKIETHLPVNVAYPVLARTRVRDAVAFYDPSPYTPPAAPDADRVALCGLTRALELTEFLYRGQRNRELNRWLQVVVEQHGDPAISDIIRAVDAGRGDIAVAAIG